MIKFENGLVNISGKGIDILSEYAVITHGIKKMFAKNGGEEKEIIEQLRHSFEYGLMNEEELDKEIKELRNTITEQGTILECPRFGKVLYNGQECFHGVLSNEEVNRNETSLSDCN